MVQLGRSGVEELRSSKLGFCWPIHKLFATTLILLHQWLSLWWRSPCRGSLGSKSRLQAVVRVSTARGLLSAIRVRTAPVVLGERAIVEGGQGMVGNVDAHVLASGRRYIVGHSWRGCVGLLRCISLHLSSGELVFLLLRCNPLRNGVYPCQEVREESWIGLLGVAADRADHKDSGSW